MVWNGDKGCVKGKETILKSSQRERDVTFDRVFVPQGCKFLHKPFGFAGPRYIATGTAPGNKEWCQVANKTTSVA